MTKLLLKHLSMLVLLPVSIQVQLANATNVQKSDNKSAIFIVGSGRCGSSCLSGVLHIMGAEFGNYIGNNGGHFDQYNPTGYFEEHKMSTVAWKITDSILDINFFLSPRLVKWDQVVNKEELKNRFKEEIRNEYSEYPIFAVKSGYFSYVIPLLAQAAIELGYSPKFIVPVRNPHEVVQSWHNHHLVKDIPVEKLYAMISFCLMNILECSTQYDTLLIDFDDILNNIPGVVDKLCKFIPQLKSYELIKEEIGSFINKDLQHFKKSIGMLQ